MKKSLKEAKMMSSPLKSRFPWNSMHLLSNVGGAVYGMYNWATGGSGTKKYTRLAEVEKEDPTADRVDQVSNILKTPPAAASQAILPQNMAVMPSVSNPSMELVPAFVRQREDDVPLERGLVPAFVSQQQQWEEEPRVERSFFRRYAPGTPLLGLPYAAMNSGAKTNGAAGASAAGAEEGFFSKAYSAASGAYESASSTLGSAWSNLSWTTKAGVTAVGLVGAAYLAYKVYNYLKQGSGVTINNNNSNTQNVNINFDCNGGCTVKKVKSPDGTETYIVSNGRQEELLAQLLKEVQAQRAAASAA